MWGEWRDAGRRRGEEVNRLGGKLSPRAVKSWGKAPRGRFPGWWENEERWGRRVRSTGVNVHWRLNVRPVGARCDEAGVATVRHIEVAWRGEKVLG